ncbi:hypothetical protein [Microbulbifer hainanensis]|uniref:hypothetical protein n=1 Tax=Microbulbifer hainanensis TaxID=2735675 RepID=UPI00186821BE|nr:hypothetical protein [Microbulbifer hainanensis]
MDYHKQFILARQPLDLPGWRQIGCRDWWLSLAGNVPLVTLRDTAGAELGYLVGWVIFRGRLLADGDSITSRQQTDGMIDEYDELGGRFVYFVTHGSELAVLTDAAALMPVVYNADQQLLASTPSIMSLLEPQQWDESVKRTFLGGKGEVWYPFGVTPYVGVRRLLPNHRLDLGSWNAERLFPLAAGPGLRGDASCNVEEAVARIAKLLNDNLYALVNQGHDVIHLTGGFDSRMVLAAASNIRNRVQLQTVKLDGDPNRLDCHIASKLARRFSLRHRLIPFVRPTVEEVEAWLQRSGYCVEDVVTTMCATARVHDQKRHEITGTCGEALRAPYWYAGDEHCEDLTIVELLQRFEIVVNDETKRLCKGWLDGLPAGMSVGNLLDLAYVELRVACWAGPSLYGHDILLPSISPFSSGAYYKTILSVPEPQRINNNLARMLVSNLWPELLPIPVNRAQGLDKLRFIRQEIRRTIPIEIRDRIKRLLQSLRVEGSPLEKYQSKSRG